MKPFVTGTLVAVTAVSLTANALLYLRWSPNRPLVKVGSTVITKSEYQGAVDYQTQGGILKKMVLADLVAQAAAKAGVVPTDADIDARLADIQRRNPQAVAEANRDGGGKMAQLRDDLKNQIALENLRIKGVSLTDAEAAVFYAQHKSAFALPRQVHTTVVMAGNAVDAGTAAGLLQQNIKLDVIARQPRLHVAGLNGFNPNWSALPPAIYQKMTGMVFSMKPGQVQTMPLDPKDFVVLKSNASESAGVPPLAQIKPAVARMAKLQKAPSEAVELAALYQAAPPRFNVSRYADYFQDLSTMDTASASNGKKTASAQ